MEYVLLVTWFAGIGVSSYQVEFALGELCQKAKGELMLHDLRVSKELAPP